MAVAAPARAAIPDYAPVANPAGLPRPGGMPSGLDYSAMTPPEFARAFGVSLSALPQLVATLGLVRSDGSLAPGAPPWAATGSFTPNTTGLPPVDLTALNAARADHAPLTPEPTKRVLPMPVSTGPATSLQPSQIAQVANAGYFAQGGKFQVPGRGQGDTTLVKMMASPGEKVIVVPKGQQPQDFVGKLPHFALGGLSAVDPNDPTGLRRIDPLGPRGSQDLQSYGNTGLTGTGLDANAVPGGKAATATAANSLGPTSQTSAAPSATQPQTTGTVPQYPTGDKRNPASAGGDGTFQAYNPTLEAALLARDAQDTSAQTSMGALTGRVLNPQTGQYDATVAAKHDAAGLLADFGRLPNWNMAVGSQAGQDMGQNAALEQAFHDLGYGPNASGPYAPETRYSVAQRSSFMPGPQGDAAYIQSLQLSADPVAREYAKYLTSRMQSGLGMPTGQDQGGQYTFGAAQPYTPPQAGMAGGTTGAVQMANAMYGPQSPFGMAQPRTVTPDVPPVIPIAGLPTGTQQFAGVLNSAYGRRLTAAPAPAA